jgi:uncharacterized membrane protein YeaQ/YmgE (transglycosylase-associated protein family)
MPSVANFYSGTLAYILSEIDTGLIVKGYGYGLLGNILVGIVGAAIAGALLPRLGIFPGGDLIGRIVSATIGLVALLVVIGLVRRVA